MPSSRNNTLFAIPLLCFSCAAVGLLVGYFFGQTFKTDGESYRRADANKDQNPSLVNPKNLVTFRENFDSMKELLLRFGAKDWKHERDADQGSEEWFASGTWAKGYKTECTIRGYDASKIHSIRVVVTDVPKSHEAEVAKSVSAIAASYVSMPSLALKTGDGISRLLPLEPIGLYVSDLSVRPIAVLLETPEQGTIVVNVRPVSLIK